MILPAVVMKVIGFVDKSGVVHKKPIQESNDMKVQLDNGKVVVISHYSSNKQMNSLADYLDNKATQGIKSNKVKELTGDLLVEGTPATDSLMQKEMGRIMQNEAGITENAARKKAAMNVATKILKNRQLVQSSAVIRSALAFTEDYQKVNVKSIYTKWKDGVQVYDTSGIYSQAMLPNHIPVELEAIVDREGVFKNFFKLTTSSLIRGVQCMNLLKHCERTILHNINKGQSGQMGPFYIPYFFHQNNIGPEAVRLNEIYKINSALDRETILQLPLAREALDLMQKLTERFKADESLYKYFKVQLPLLMDVEKYASGLKYVNPEGGGKSPFQMFRNAIVNMNFSKEEAGTKELLKKFILNEFLSKMSQGLYRPKLLLTYTLAGNPVIGDGISWGFMQDNIDYGKMTLGIDDAKFILESCEGYLEHLRNSGQVQRLA